MKSRLNVFQAVTAILVIGFALVAFSAQAAKVNGTLYSLSTSPKSVTLKNGGVLTTIKLSPKTKISRNGAKTTINGMVLGDKVTASYKSSLYPSKLKATGSKIRTVQGTVQHITSTGVVQIAGGNVGTGIQTRVVRNGSVSSLDAVAINDTVVAHVDDSTGEAEDIQSEGPDETDIQGTITAVDTTASTVTVEDAPGITVTVTVDANTRIDVSDSEGTINDLVAGMLVDVEYDPVTLLAFHIEAGVEGEDNEIEGIVTAVDAVNGSITIQDENGTSVTVSVDAGTQIERDDEPAFLSDILVGDSGKAEYDINTLVASEIEAESPEIDDDSPGI